MPLQPLREDIVAPWAWSNCQILWIAAHDSGGFPWRGFVCLSSTARWFLNSIDEFHPGTDQRQEKGAIQAPPALLGHVEQLESH